MPTRRRMDPAARRRDILDHAAALFAERPYSQVTTADIARAAGVTRALVHHYCGGVRDIFIVVAVEFGAAMKAVRNHGTEMPFEQRVATNCAAYLDVVDENRELWRAIMGQVVPDSDALALLRAGIEANVDSMIEGHADMLTNTPATRVCLRAFIGFLTVAVHEWLTGAATREQTERLLVAMLIATVRNGVPAAELRDTAQAPAERARPGEAS